MGTACPHFCHTFVLFCCPQTSRCRDGSWSMRTQMPSTTWQLILEHMERPQATGNTHDCSAWPNKIRRSNLPCRLQATRMLISNVILLWKLIFTKPVRLSFQITHLPIASYPNIDMELKWEYTRIAKRRDYEKNDINSSEKVNLNLNSQFWKAKGDASCYFRCHMPQ